MLKKVKLILCLVVFGLACTQGQETRNVSELDIETYLALVKELHPQSQIFNNLLDIADADVLKARAAFDPKVQASWKEKQFDSKNYYEQLSTQIKVPTTIGLDFNAGYEQNNGEFLNPERNTPENGLIRLGVSLNLLNGLLVDERRTALKLAKLYRETAEQKRRINLNELLYVAAETYFLWEQAFESKSILANARDLSVVYLESTRDAFFAGEKTALDTLEAHILFLDNENMVQQGQLIYAKMLRNMELFIWQDERPLLQLDSLVPTVSKELPAELLVQNNMEDNLALHPKIQYYQTIERQLNVKERLIREQLKPQLAMGFNQYLGDASPWVDNEANYQLKASFSMPLYWRKGRADRQRNDILQDNNRQMLIEKSRTISIENRNLIQQDSFLNTQIDIQIQNIENYRLLMEGEFTKLQFGESSLFLVNKRQEKFVESQIKLLQLKMKRKLLTVKRLYNWNHLPELF